MHLVSRNRYVGNHSSSISARPYFNGMDGVLEYERWQGKTRGRCDNIGLPDCVYFSLSVPLPALDTQRGARRSSLGLRAVSAQFKVDLGIASE